MKIVFQISIKITKEALRVNFIIWNCEKRNNYIVDFYIVRKTKGERSCPSGKPDFVVFDFIFHLLFFSALFLSLLGLNLFSSLYWACIQRIMNIWFILCVNIIYEIKWPWLLFLLLFSIISWILDLVCKKLHHHMFRGSLDNYR